MKRFIRLILGLTITLTFGGSLSCATSFVGDAQFPGGALGCFKQCQTNGMEMATFVYVGEYSTACACKPKVAGSGQRAQAEQGDEGAVVAAAAGAEMQRRRAQEQARQQSFVAIPH